MSQYRFLTRGQVPGGKLCERGEVVTINDDAFVCPPHMLCIDDKEPAAAEPPTTEAPHE